MVVITARHWSKPGEFHGKPQEEDFKLVEEQLDDENLKDGEVLCEALYLSVDPYMGIPGEYLGKPFGKFKTMFGGACSKVIKSRHEDFKEGTLVLSLSGWRTHFISTNPKKELRPILFDLGELSPSLTLGCLGMPGLTAYFGLRLAQPKSGDVCVVSGAAGAVGSVVSQLAKAKGCTVIGFAGTDDKVAWLTDKAKLDYAFNYKKVTLAEALKKAAPNGVNVYFDNVGGDFYDEMIRNHMAQRGRVTICGSISNYRDQEPKKYAQNNVTIFLKELSIYGVLITSYENEYKDALAEMAPMVKQGTIQYQETITDSFEQMPKAFVGLFSGSNTGKAIIKAK